MKLSEFVNKYNLTLLTKSGFEDREVTGCYIGDLLSWVMGKAKSGDAWLTIMNNINITAVASLTDTACIILCENVGADEAVIKRADTEDIVIFKTEKSIYEMACALSGDI